MLEDESFSLDMSMPSLFSSFFDRMFGDFEDREAAAGRSRPPPHEFPRGQYPKEKKKEDPFQNYSGRVDEV